MRSILTAEGTAGPQGPNGIVIRLAIEKTEPLTGIAEAACRCASVPFVGWLEMLRAISGLVAADASMSPNVQPATTAPLTRPEGDQDLS